jgi:1,4-dihydroxy-2-naphthoyl-CoA hydrolase
MQVFTGYKDINLSKLNEMLRHTLSETLGMEVTELGPDHLTMRMPVDHRTKQPFGVLNGGASLALAESAGSMAGNMVVSKEKYCAGLEINANHLRAVRDGWVHATATPIHLGGKTQVWDIRIKDDHGHLVCISRLTLAVLDKK